MEPPSQHRKSWWTSQHQFVQKSIYNCTPCKMLFTSHATTPLYTCPKCTVSAPRLRVESINHYWVCSLFCCHVCGEHFYLRQNTNPITQCMTCARSGLFTLVSRSFITMYSDALAWMRDHSCRRKAHELCASTPSLLKIVQDSVHVDDIAKYICTTYPLRAISELTLWFPESRREFGPLVGKDLSVESPAVLKFAERALTKYLAHESDKLLAFCPFCNSFPTTCTAVRDLESGTYGPLDDFDDLPELVDLLSLNEKE